MYFQGSLSNKLYQAGALLARAGEGEVFLVCREPSKLLKRFTVGPDSHTVKKLDHLSRWPVPSLFTAFPLETVYNPATNSVIGFIQPYYRRAVPYSRVLDAHGRKSLRLPNDLAFRVKLCRLLAEAFERVHAANLVIGDVSDGNFLLGFDWLRRATVAYVIDCNSFQVTLRTASGNECYVSGIATEEYAAPEVQPTDWATSLRSVHSDSFGFAVLAWKILFGGSHPFSVVTPRSVDVPPLGERIEKRLFPFSPGSPWPANWSAPAIQPSLAILPAEIRERFFRTFSASDPRDRPTATEWLEAFRDWQASLRSSIPLRVFGSSASSLANSSAETLSALKPYIGRFAVFATLVGVTIGTNLDCSSSPSTQALIPNANQFQTKQQKARSNTPHRERRVDPDLFPELTQKPLRPQPENR